MRGLTVILVLAFAIVVFIVIMTSSCGLTAATIVAKKAIELSKEDANGKTKNREVGVYDGLTHNSNNNGNSNDNSSLDSQLIVQVNLTDISSYSAGGILDPKYRKFADLPDAERIFKSTSDLNRPGLVFKPGMHHIMMVLKTEGSGFLLLGLRSDVTDNDAVLSQVTQTIEKMSGGAFRIVATSKKIAKMSTNNCDNMCEAEKLMSLDDRMNSSDYSSSMVITDSKLVDGVGALGARKQGTSYASWDTRAIVHEYLHNLGVAHSNDATNQEYMDPYCIMGNGEISVGLNAAHTYWLGWLKNAKFVNFGKMQEAFSRGESITISTGLSPQDGIVVFQEVIPLNKQNNNQIAFTESAPLPLMFISFREIKGTIYHFIHVPFFQWKKNPWALRPSTRLRYYGTSNKSVVIDFDIFGKPMDYFSTEAKWPVTWFIGNALHITRDGAVNEEKVRKALGVPDSVVRGILGRLDKKIKFTFNNDNTPSVTFSKG